MDKTVSSLKLKSVCFSWSFQLEMVSISCEKNNHFIYLIKEKRFFFHTGKDGRDGINGDVVIFMDT